MPSDGPRPNAFRDARATSPGQHAKFPFRAKPPHGSIVTKPSAILWVPKRHPIVLASFMIEPHYANAINNENDMKNEAIHRIEKD